MLLARRWQLGEISTAEFSVEFAAKKKAKANKEAGAKKERKEPKCTGSNYLCKGQGTGACISGTKSCKTDLKGGNVNPLRRKYIDDTLNALRESGKGPQMARIGRKLGAASVALTPDQYQKALEMGLSGRKLSQGDATREQLRKLGVDVNGVTAKPKAPPTQQKLSASPEDQARYIEDRLTQIRKTNIEASREAIGKRLTESQARLSQEEEELKRLNDTSPKSSRPVNASGYLIPLAGDTVVIPSNARVTGGMAGLFKLPTAIVNPDEKTMTVQTIGVSKFRQGQKLSIDQYDVKVDGDPRSRISRQEKYVKEAADDVRKSQSDLAELDRPDEFAQELDRSVVASVQRYAQEGFDFMGQSKESSIKAGDEIASIPINFPDDASREKITRTQDDNLFSLADGEEYQVFLDNRKEPYAFLGVKTGSGVANIPSTTSTTSQGLKENTELPSSTPTNQKGADRPTQNWKGTTGNADLDLEIERLRAKRYKTPADEFRLDRLSRLEKLDPNRWSAGQGVGIRVISGGRYEQVNRGAQIVEVDAATKSALVRYVADTGNLTVGGGNADPRTWKAERIPLVDLIRDDKYSEA